MTNLTPQEREVIAQALAWRTDADGPECMPSMPFTHEDELRGLAAKLGVTEEFELALRQLRTELAGYNVNEWVLQ